jgi:hypothetical protein
MSSASPESADQVQRWEWADFIANHPPGHGEQVPVDNFCTVISAAHHVIFPDIEIFCDSERCKGRFQHFRPTQDPDVKFYTASPQAFRINYECRNCGETYKQYWIGVSIDESKKNSGFATKMGENPPFMPPISKRLTRIFKEDKKLFENARSDENQGKGIGAFAYYRRIVENQKNRIIDEIIKVAEREKNNELIEILKNAKEKKEFSQAVNDIKEHIPESIRINGKNPLTLLHRALSKGLHASTDDECLKMAGAIRMVLIELVKNIEEALKDKQDLSVALEALDDQS